MSNPYRSNSCSFAGVALLVALLVTTANAERPKVETPKPEVAKAEATVDHVMFDRNNPPKDMPPMRPGDAAFTQFNFNCSVKVSYRVVSTANVRDGVEVRAEIGKISTAISLTNKIYLPNGASPALRAHEEGHREINERVYRDAEKVAREESEKVVAQVWTGRGRDTDAAGKTATDAAVTAVCKAYLARTADYASRVGDLYDDLTDHGRNQSVQVADAIKQSFSRADRERAAAKK